MTLKVLLGRRFMDADLAYLKAGTPRDIQFLEPEAYTPQGIGGALAAGANVLLGEPPSETVLARATDLRLIQVPWTGVDRLDMEMLARLNVPVCNSHSNAGVVAEHALALALASLKGLTHHDALMRKGDWARPGSPTFRVPARVSGSRALILGLGAIGLELARMLTALGMTVDALVTRPRDSVPSDVTNLILPEGLDHGLIAADVVFVCLPLTDLTRGLIDERRLRAMKPTAHLVNVSRGEIVNEDALFRALAEGWIGGAAIDVWYNYPKPGESSTMPSVAQPFEVLDRLVMSPHRAGFAPTGFPHLDDALENLNRLNEGREPLHRIDPAAGY